MEVPTLFLGVIAAAVVLMSADSSILWSTLGSQGESIGGQNREGHRASS